MYAGLAVAGQLIEVMLFTTGNPPPADACMHAVLTQPQITWLKLDAPLIAVRRRIDWLLNMLCLCIMGVRFGTSKPVRSGNKVAYHDLL